MTTRNIFIAFMPIIDRELNWRWSTFWLSGTRASGCYGITRTAGRTENRYAGYCEALRAAGVAPDPALVISREDWTAGGDLAPLLAKLSDLLLEDPTALVICSEDLLLPATHALYRLNRRVPDDLSVIGFECPEVSRYTQPPMTTVDGNTDLVAERVVQLVESLRENPDVPPQQVVLPASLISRHSVRAYSCPRSSAVNPML